MGPFPLRFAAFGKNLCEPTYGSRYQTIYIMSNPKRLDQLFERTHVLDEIGDKTIIFSDPEASSDIYKCILPFSPKK